MQLYLVCHGNLGVFIRLVQFQGVLALPPDIAPTFMKLDIMGGSLAMISVACPFFVNFFDTTGTLLGVANRAKLVGWMEAQQVLISFKS